MTHQYESDGSCSHRVKARCGVDLEAIPVVPVDDEGYYPSWEEVPTDLPEGWAAVYGRREFIEATRLRPDGRRETVFCSRDMIPESFGSYVPGPHDPDEMHEEYMIAVSKTAIYCRTIL